VTSAALALAVIASAETQAINSRLFLMASFPLQNETIRYFGWIERKAATTST
jgi:hypothetical protein